MQTAHEILLALQEEEHTETTEETHEPDGLDLVLPEPAELIGGAIAFALVSLFLWKKAFPAIRNMVQKRADTIQNDLEEAENAKVEAKRIQEEYQGKIAEAKSEANRILEEARQSAEQVRKDLIAKAEGEAKQVVERAQEQIGAERQRTLQELQGQVADLSIELAEKVVGRSLDAPAQREMVDAYIREVSGMQSTNGGSR